MGFSYPWDDESRALVAPMDLVARAAEFGDVPLQVIVGREDDAAGFIEPSRELAGKANTAQLVEIEGMPHVLVDDEGVEPAPQNSHASQVDEAAVAFFREHLST